MRFHVTNTHPIHHPSEDSMMYITSCHLCGSKSYLKIPMIARIAGPMDYRDVAIQQFELQVDEDCSQAERNNIARRIHES